jgi:TonB family protein
MSVVVHAAVIALLLLAPRLELFQPDPSEARVEPERAPRDEAPTFVVVEPLRDEPAPAPPERAELSDLDRMARAPEIAERPENALPFSHGDSAERIEAAPEERPAGSGPDPTPTPPEPERPAEEVMSLPERPTAAPAPTPPRNARAGGALGDALRDLQRYVQKESLQNPKGGTSDFGPAIQFDTKGVEFGPWIRRFVAQVKRNWMIPNAALAMRGRVVIQFNVHRDGRITDLAIVGPSEVDSFNRAAFNALASSSPTQPLPPEYPDDKAFFTVTFFYNEPPVP